MYAYKGGIRTLKYCKALHESGRLDGLTFTSSHWRVRLELSQSQLLLFQNF